MSFHRVLFCAIVLLAGSPVFAEDYKIRLTRPAKVGQKHEVIASAEKSEHTTLSAQGRVLKESKLFLSATLEGTTTVLKVDKLRREAEVRLLVLKCRKKMNGNATEKEVLPKGTQVVVRRRDSKQEFLIDGKVVSKDIANVLDLFFSLPQTQATADDVFGTKERKKVGDRWATNTMKAAKTFASVGFKVDAENIKGSVTIEKAVVVRGTRCLHLTGKTELDMFELPLPAGLTVEKSSMSILFSSDFPVDTSLGSLSDKTSMTMALVAKGKPSPDAPEITLSMKMSRSKQMTRKLLK